MPLREIIEHKLVSCSPQAKIKEVADEMKDKDVGAVLVTENDKPVGIVTDRDIVVRCVSEDLDLNSEVRQIMSKTVDTVSVNDGIQDVVKHMKEKKVRRIPVVDESGRAVGLLSFGDMFALLAKEMGELSETTTFKKAEKVAA